MTGTTPTPDGNQHPSSHMLDAYRRAYDACAALRALPAKVWVKKELDLLKGFMERMATRILDQRAEDLLADDLEFTDGRPAPNHQLNCPIAAQQAERHAQILAIRERVSHPGAGTVNDGFASDQLTREIGILDELRYQPEKVLGEPS